MLSLSAQGCDVRLMRGVWRPLESSYGFTGTHYGRAFLLTLLRTQKRKCAYIRLPFCTLPYKVTLGLASTLDVDRRPTLVPLVWSGHWLYLGFGTLLTTAYRAFVRRVLNLGGATF